MSFLKKAFTKRLILIFAFVTFQFSVPIAFANQFNWVDNANFGNGQWWGSAISSNGNVIVGSQRTAGISLSTNGGTTVSRPITTNTYWFDISNDGSVIFATGAESNDVQISTNSGSTWTQKNLSTSKHAICMTPDGRYMMTGGPTSTYLYLSTDTGTTFNTVTSAGTGANYWYGCAMSDDGQIIYALTYNTGIKKSVDGGSNWTNLTLPAGKEWFSVETSADGQIVVATAASQQQVYLSTDGGATFSLSYTSGSYIRALAMSADGNIILIGGDSSASPIVVSTDRGSTWNNETIGGQWGSIHITPDGSRVIAARINNTPQQKMAIATYLAPTSISVTFGGNAILYFRTSNTITATANYAGKVTFYANGKKIGNCVSIPTNVSLVATCNYKPTIHGAVTISARLVPTNVSYSAITTELFRTKIASRTTTR